MECSTYRIFLKNANNEEKILKHAECLQCLTKSTNIKNVHYTHIPVTWRGIAAAIMQHTAAHRKQAKRGFFRPNLEYTHGLDIAVCKTWFRFLFCLA